MSLSAARQLGRISVSLAVLFALAAAVQHARASNPPPRCASSSLSVVAPRPQGTATQMVAFVSILNRGVACRLEATASLTVTRNAAPVTSIRGNPASYRINQRIGAGTTVLFDAWWGNWCASRSGPFRAVGAVGKLRAAASYPYLPVCIGAGHVSSLRGVRYAPARGTRTRAAAAGWTAPAGA